MNSKASSFTSYYQVITSVDFECSRESPFVAIGNTHYRYEVVKSLYCITTFFVWEYLL